MDAGRSLPALFFGIFLAGPAGAAAVVDGNYGDKEGCLYSETGESSGSDIFFLLNREGVTTAVSYCAFKGDGRKVGGATMISAECHEEGSTEATPYEMTLTPDHGGYTVGFADGTRWGPLMRCKK